LIRSGIKADLVDLIPHSPFPTRLHPLVGFTMGYTPSLEDYKTMLRDAVKVELSTIPVRRFSLVFAAQAIPIILLFNSAVSLLDIQHQKRWSRWHQS
jgi:hypothetical protein